MTTTPNPTRTLLRTGATLIVVGAVASLGTSLLTRIGEAATVITGAVMAILQAIDGVALKHAVDSWAAAPVELRAAAFRDVETVRWIEWAMAGYFRIVLGVAVIALGLAVLRSGAIPRWTGAVVLLAGLAHITTGTAIGYSGFEGTVREATNLLSWAALMVFAVAATISAWWGRGTHAGQPHPAPSLHGSPATPAAVTTAARG